MLTDLRGQVFKWALYYPIGFQSLPGQRFRSNLVCFPSPKGRSLKGFFTPAGRSVSNSHPLQLIGCKPMASHRNSQASWVAQLTPISPASAPCPPTSRVTKLSYTHMVLPCNHQSSHLSLSRLLRTHPGLRNEGQACQDFPPKWLTSWPQTTS